jgi:hypothetical protein
VTDPHHDGALLRAIAERAGFFDGEGPHGVDARVTAATRDTVGALAANLTAAGREILAGALPVSLHEALRSEARSLGALTPRALFAIVARHTALAIGPARELVQSILTEVSSTLSEPNRDTLRSMEPDAWADLLPDPERRRVPPIATPGGQARGHTLADGQPAAQRRVGERRTHSLAGARPGSRRPLAEARPARGQARSIAATDDPRGGRKLSGAGPDDDA